jgi:hypothetical protein
MSNCNYTSIIYEQENIGDSLVKINNNFNNLDNAICEIKTNQTILSANNTVLPPALSSTPVAWVNIFINSVEYKLPLYQ